MMQGYKEPGFQDRMAMAQSAKNKSLAQMRNKPATDPAEQARRMAKQAVKDENQRIRRAAAEEAKQVAQTAREAEQMAKREQDRLSAAAAETALSSAPRILTEAELKEARDLRYAARKARKTEKS